VQFTTSLDARLTEAPGATGSQQHRRKKEFYIVFYFYASRISIHAGKKARMMELVASGRLDGVGYGWVGRTKN
jgi:hypothetical protein